MRIDSSYSSYPTGPSGAPNPKIAIAEVERYLDKLEVCSCIGILKDMKKNYNLTEPVKEKINALIDLLEKGPLNQELKTKGFRLTNEIYQMLPTLP